jgi:acetyl-CoA C-acetyltransferase
VGEQWDKSLKDLFTESSIKALDDVGIDKIDAIYVGNMSSDIFQGQANLGALLSDCLGVYGIPAVRVEAACASGGLAVHEGLKAVASGLSDFVLVTGVEKMTDVQTPEATSALMMGEDQEYAAFSGISFVGLHALIERLYMDKFKVNPEHIATFAVNAHKNSVNNPYAQFHNLISVEDVLKSPMIADPMRLLECSSICDGAASIILCPLDIAKKFTDTPIEIKASTVATDKLSLPEREDILTFSATRVAVENALKIAHINIQDVDVIEVHDAFSIVGIISLEDLGFVKKGEGANFVSDGQIEIDGKLPTNTLGGLKGRGHPIGATGVYQIIDLVRQLMGEAGKSQVKNAEIGLAQNIGGTGATAVINILARV